MTSFIESIYCYCDQWCERCRFADRCAVFSGSDALAGVDPESPGFWEKMLAQFAASHGHIPGVSEWEIEVRRPTAAELAEGERRQLELERRLAEEPCFLAAQQYDGQLLQLIEDRNYWRAHARASARAVSMGIRSAQSALKEADVVTECLTVLRRQCEVLNSRLVDALVADAGEGPLHDANGLAKVALVAIASARQALTTLYGIFPDEDHLLPLFGTLSVAEKEIEARFPGARAFLRPGFDSPLPEVVLQSSLDHAV